MSSDVSAEGERDQKSLVDFFGRAPTDLRISVTDRCNFRCGYCMPRDKVDVSKFLPKSEVLDFEEIVRVATRFVGLGTRKLRITGGEPLLRRDLPLLIEQLSRLPVEIALTTNGVLLPRFSQALKAAGVGRVTVSLDALDDAVFRRMCDAPGFGPHDVLDGIKAAEDAGLPVKVNCVVRRGENEQEILPLVRHFSGQPIPVRFIEYMDVGTMNGWDLKGVVSKADILATVARDGPLFPIEPASPGEVAVRYRGPHGEVGVIASVTEPFCGSCCRARLSADGKVYTCLFAHEGLDLKSKLRAGQTDAQLDDAIARLWRARTDRYSEIRSARTARDEDAVLSSSDKVRLPTVGQRVEMSYIGG